MNPEPVPITEQLVPGAAQAIGDGFHDDEIWTWLLPREWQIRRVLPRYYRALMRRIFIPRGGAWTTSDTSGGALWFPPGTQSLSLPEQLHPGVSLLPEGIACLPKGRRWERLIHAHRPKEPHWCLNSLAVSTSAQRRGVGTALIKPGLALADADACGCYVVTQRRANIPFYRRFGFEEIGEIGLRDSPTVWRMWRKGKSEHSIVS